jgi:pyridoxal phosphate enzyme (YggS family)
MATVTQSFDHVAAALGAVQARIAAAAKAAGRAPNTVTLVAVSKAFPAEAAQAALAAGHRVFGENRVQEAQAKWPALRARYPDVQLHLIGPLQTNKVKQAVALFDVIETVDRPRLAAALADEMDKTGKRPECMVEINTGAEAQKSGVLPAEADAFIERCKDEFALPVMGLMCIPPLEGDPAPHFAMLAEIAARNGLAKLSMGMSADFETAIRAGATHVRLGTAIFGMRPAHRAHG